VLRIFATVLAALFFVLAIADASADVFSLGGTRDSATGVWTGQASLEFVTVGDAGNAADTTGFGSVGYVYQMGKYDVTNAQYCEFLNAKLPTITDPAAGKLLPSDIYGLYNINMMTASIGGGIDYNPAAATGAKFSIVPGKGNWPVTYVSWYDTIRFANWLQNGQGNGDTETGTYSINAGGQNSGTVAVPDAATRAVWTTAHWVLPSQDEWYKAAYHQNGAATVGYWIYPTKSNTAPVNVLSATGTNNANFYDNYGTGNGGYADPVNYITPVGTFAASPGPYGTFDMGGDVFQWNEAMSVLFGSSGGGLRGGSWSTYSNSLASSGRVYGDYPTYESGFIGFRVASVGVPEPSTIAILMAGAVVVLAYAWRRRPRLVSSSKAVICTAAVYLALLAATARAASMPIVNINPSSQYDFNEAHGNGMIGWTFSVEKSITVTKVGIYDDGQDGLSRAFQVGLWRFDATSNPPQLLGTPSSGTTIPAGTVAPLNGVWRTVNLATPLVLVPGGYELAVLDTATTSDAIRYYQTEYSDPSLGLTTSAFFYADISGQTSFHFVDGYHFYLAPGLELGPMLFVDVPEPSTLALLFAAATCLLGYAWRRRA
jgi:formylglycine-generating enzyme